MSESLDDLRSVVAKPRQPQKEVISVRLGPELQDRMEALSQRLGVGLDRSSVIRRALSEWLDRSEALLDVEGT